MKVIVQEKFYQNDNFQAKLLDTGVNTLIEATTDTFWGVGALLGSKSLSTQENGQVLNTLGQILGKVREDIKRTKGWEQSREKSCEQDHPLTPNPNAGANPTTQQRPRNNYVE